MTAYKQKGFTLIELLIVIAILGTLAVVVLLALNPVQQLARTRDAGRFSGVTQLGHAVEAYATGNNGVYPAEAAWATTLQTAGEIATVPAGINYSASPVTAGCGSVGGNNMINNTWCYDTGANGTVVYTRMESQSNRAKCAAGQEAWAVYSTAAGRGGGVCGNAPTPGVTSFQF